MAMGTFSDILDEELLINLAGDRFFERGVRYFENGYVYSLAQYDEHITAQVKGTSIYKVDFWLEDDELSYYPKEGSGCGLINHLHHR